MRELIREKIVVKRKKNKPKQNGKPRHVDGIRLSKPTPNFYYRKVEKGETSKVAAKDDKIVEKSNEQVSQREEEGFTSSMVASNEVQLKNSFSSLGDEESDWEWDGSKLKVINESDSEDIDDEMIMEGPNVNTNVSSTGSSTPDANDDQSIHVRVWLKLEFSQAIFKPNEFKEHALRVVTDGWSTQISGFHMYRVTKKLKLLNKPLRKLLYEKGNLHNNVNQLRNDLDQVQIRLDADLFDVSIREEEATVLAAFNEACLIKEKFLKQKAKIDWIREGDSNSAYFHKAVKSRISRSRIDVLTSDDGMVYENDKVAEAFVHHYEMFLRQPGDTTYFCANDLFRCRLEENEALDMTRPVTRQEVKSALFSMGNDKSPGPDGYTAAFFKESWDIVADSLLLFLNKIIANRIKESLKVLVSPNQSAFVLGRSITDNILLTQELMNNYHLDRGLPRCAFKVDIQKAYDTVDWVFL
ncbi:hypothetical protein Tco_1546998, partial [Tanacetum coccineum]